MGECRMDANELKKRASEFRVLDRILLSGTVYTARDAAHKRMMQLLDENKELPFSLEGAFVYYAGPSPSPEHLPIGSCGPTTSGRMDVFAPRLLDLGLGGMIGKGARSQVVIDALVRNQGLYLCAIGGAGALACKAITDCEIIAFEDLGCESVKKLTLHDFPLMVAIDTEGNDIFKLGPETYRQEFAK